MHDQKKIKNHKIVIKFETFYDRLFYFKRKFSMPSDQCTVYSLNIVQAASWLK